MWTLRWQWTVGARPSERSTLAWSECHVYALYVYRLTSRFVRGCAKRAACASAAPMRDSGRAGGMRMGDLALSFDFFHTHDTIFMSLIVSTLYRYRISIRFGFYSYGDRRVPWIDIEDAMPSQDPRPIR